MPNTNLHIDKWNNAHQTLTPPTILNWRVVIWLLITASTLYTTPTLAEEKKPKPTDYYLEPSNGLTPLEILQAHRKQRSVSASVSTALQIETDSQNETAVLPKSTLSKSVDYYSNTSIPIEMMLSTPLPKKVLRVVGVKEPAIVFEKDKYRHGLGYSLANDLAYSLKLDYKFKTVSSAAAALKALKKGEADIAITTLNNSKPDNATLQHVALNCDDKNFKTYGNSTNLNFSFSPQNVLLKKASADFLCLDQQKLRTQNLYEMYDQTAVKELNNTKAFYRQTLAERLPPMKPTFQQYAKQFKLDWQLLVAISFQESLLSADAVSPTGVTGVMMLTQATAADMGVKNRNDPIESIYGGSRYIAMLLNDYNSLPKMDSLWFSLAAYNMGKQNVNDIRAKLKKQKLNPDNWNDFYHYLAQNQAKNSQYTQCMQYVRRIRSYLEMIKTDKQLVKI